MKRNLNQWLVPLIGIGLMTLLLARNLRQGSDAAEFPGVGNPLPELMVAGWLNGEPVTGEDLAGKVVVIDCSASWCGPCRIAAPHLVETYHKFQPRRVAFVGLSSETIEREREMLDFVDAFEIPWPIGYGAMFTLEVIGANYLPTVLVVGRDGKIAYGGTGWNADSPAELNRAIENALAAQPSRDGEQGAAEE